MSKNDKPKLSKRYYVYGLYEEGSEEPFYIGKGSRGKNRPRVHLQEARLGCECIKCSVIREIWTDGKQVEGWALLETDDEDEAFTEECRLIAEYGHEVLVNKTKGGEGRSSETVRKHRDYLEDRKARRQAFINERGSFQPRLWGSVFDQIEAKYAKRA